jgi:hypothetical protein
MVDLPAPFGPTSDMTFRGSTRNETSFTAKRASYATEMFRASSISYKRKLPTCAFAK